MFYILYKLYQLIYIIKKFMNIYDDKNKIDNDYCKSLKDTIFNSGCIGIKFSQWILSKMRSEPSTNCNFAIEYFEDLFDDCPRHSWKLASKNFKKSFKFNIEDIIDINSIKLIASGSIGQIYSANLIRPYKLEVLSNNKNLNKKDSKFNNSSNKLNYEVMYIRKVAIKIKHPNVNKEADVYSKIFNFLSYIQKNSYLKKKFYLHFDFDDFMENITQQINLNNEMFNSNILRKNFENNDCVYIPKVLFSSKNVLISEFIEGNDFNELTEYNQLKLSLNYIAMINKMCIVDNFVHGDLHHKNWKPLLVNDNNRYHLDNIDAKNNSINNASNENNENKPKKYKIVIYDLGICFKSEDETFMRELFEVFESGNTDKLAEVALKGISKPKNSNICTEDIKELVTNTVDNFQKKALDVINITNNLNKVLSEHNLKLSTVALNMCVMFTLIDHTLKRQNIIGGNIAPNHYYNILKSKQLDLIAYCKTNNSYQDLVVFLEEKIKRLSALNKDKLEIFIKRSQDSYLSLDLPSDSDEE